MSNSLAHLLIGLVFSIWLQVYLFVVFMSTHICLCESICATCIQERQEARRMCQVSWNWRTQHMSHMMPVLGTELTPSGKVASTLNLRAISLSQFFLAKEKLYMTSLYFIVFASHCLNIYLNNSSQGAGLCLVHRPVLGLCARLTLLSMHWAPSLCTTPGELW